jgi:CheY-like chemotaxis protein
MRAAIQQEFGLLKPRAIVVDDNPNSRLMTRRRLQHRGFEVVACSTKSQFDEAWKPGMFDVIVADWHLSNAAADQGDQLLSDVRERDWDVPFVLISGRLDEDARSVPVLQSLLENGSARFVRRGSGGIASACDAAEDLIERRDLTLLKIVLSLRQGAFEGARVRTSSGDVYASQQLAELVSKPKASHDAGRPIAKRRSQRALKEKR